MLLAPSPSLGPWPETPDNTPAPFRLAATGLLRSTPRRHVLGPFAPPSPPPTCRAICGPSPRVPPPPALGGGPFRAIRGSRRCHLARKTPPPRDAVVCACRVDRRRRRHVTPHDHAPPANATPQSTTPRHRYATFC
ncbi:hypothetical protein B0H10DRAFT_2231209 [Mycena sp. CBHHK59/15]|nr:hypothetical protein B0H10DRAFT_2231209 [Mycena sp. CBHHK59/15]